MNKAFSIQWTGIVDGRLVRPQHSTGIPTDDCKACVFKNLGRRCGTFEFREEQREAFDQTCTNRVNPIYYVAAESED